MRNVFLHPLLSFTTRFFIIYLLFIAIGSHRAWANQETQKESTESSCIQCHQELDSQYSEPVALWKKSIHYRMGNSCHGCHGGDPTDMADAMNPEKGFEGVPEPTKVAEFCGRCHVGVKENYLKSPHYNASQQGKKAPTCVTCHHSHDVQQASFELINETLCSQCHSYNQAQEIKKSFVDAELGLQKETALLENLAHNGMDVRRQNQKLFALRNSLHQMTHTLDASLIKEKTSAVIKDLDQIHEISVELDKKVFQRRWIGLAIALFFLIVSLVLSSFKKTFSENE